MRNQEIVIELQAMVVYLNIVGAMYPIAPKKAIEAIERAIGIMQNEDKCVPTPEVCNGS